MADTDFDEISKMLADIIGPEGEKNPEETRDEIIPTNTNSVSFKQSNPTLSPSESATPSSNFVGNSGQDTARNEASSGNQLSMEDILKESNPEKTNEPKPISKPTTNGPSSNTPIPKPIPKPTTNGPSSNAPIPKPISKPANSSSNLLSPKPLHLNFFLKNDLNPPKPTSPSSSANNSSQNIQVPVLKPVLKPTLKPVLKTTINPTSPKPTSPSSSANNSSQNIQVPALKPVLKPTLKPVLKTTINPTSPKPTLQNIPKPSDSPSNIEKNQKNQKNESPVILISSGFQELPDDDDESPVPRKPSKPAPAPPSPSTPSIPHIEQKENSSTPLITPLDILNIPPAVENNTKSEDLKDQTKGISLDELPPLPSVSFSSLQNNNENKVRSMTEPNIETKNYEKSEGNKDRSESISSPEKPLGGLGSLSAKTGQQYKPAPASKTVRIKSNRKDEWLPIKSRSTGKTYYYNPLTKQTQWTKPTSLLKNIEPIEFKSTPRLPKNSENLQRTNSKGNTNLSNIFQANAFSIGTIRQGVLNIVFPDGSTKKVAGLTTWKPSDLLNELAEKFSLNQPHYFHFAIPTGDDKERWLDYSKTLKQQNVDNSTPILFKVKYWKKPLQLSDQFAIRLYYLQIKENILKKIWIVRNLILGLSFASLQCQINFGERDVNKHVIGYFNESSLSTLLPDYLIQEYPLVYLQRKIFLFWESHRGLSQTVAEARYVELAMNHLPDFGLSPFEVKDESNIRIFSPVPNGFRISRPQDPAYFDLYPFSIITKLSLTTTGIKIESKDPEGLKRPHFDLLTPDKETIFGYLSDYYHLLVQQGVSDLPKLPLLVSEGLPPPSLFQLPDESTPSHPDHSRASVWKSLYFSNKKKNSPKESNKQTYIDHQLLNIFDKVLENEIKKNPRLEDEVITQLDLSHIGLDVSMFSILAQTFSQSANYNRPYAEFYHFVENIKLEKLALGYSEISTPEGFHILQLLLSPREQMANIKVIEFNYINCGKNIFVDFGSSLSQSSTLESFSFTNSKLSTKDISHILKGLKNMPSISSINFDFNLLKDDLIKDSFFNEIFKKLTLRDVSFAHNDFSQDVEKTLVQKVLKFWKNARKVDFSGAKFTGKYLLPWLKENLNVENCPLANFDISSKILPVFTSEILGNRYHHINVIDVRNCKLKTQGLVDVLQAAKLKVDRIQVLKIGTQLLTKVASHTLNGFLNSTKTLHTISLRYANLHKNIVNSVLQSLQICTSLKVLEIGGNPELFTKNQLMLTNFAGVLNSSLETLDLKGSVLNIDFIGWLTSVLPECKSLKNLYLNGCNLGKEKYLERLHPGPHLTLLDLSLNELSSKPAVDFVLKLVNTKLALSLQILNLSQNGLKSSDQLQVITDLKIVV